MCGGDVFAHGQATICDVIIDRRLVPVCKRVRARRCRTIRERDDGGRGPAKREKFFSWRLHLVCTPDGLPFAFTLLRGSYHDPSMNLTVELPDGSAPTCLHLD